MMLAPGKTVIGGCRPDKPMVTYLSAIRRSLRERAILAGGSKPAIVA